MKVPKLLSILGGGDLRSDGRSNEVVQQVLSNPDLIPELVKGLSVKDPVIRGRSADALEKVGRVHHKELNRYLPLLLEKAVEDDVYMVRFHLAMLLGYLEVNEDLGIKIIDTLFRLLDDESVFVQSWSIVSLTIIGYEEERYREAILSKIRPLLHSESVAVRRKTENSLNSLEKRQPIPPGWIKKADHQ